MFFLCFFPFYIFSLFSETGPSRQTKSEQRMILTWKVLKPNFTDIHDGVLVRVAFQKYKMGNQPLISIR